MLLALKNSMNVFPHPQKLCNSKRNIMGMNPTRRDCISYTIPCIPSRVKRTACTREYPVENAQLSLTSYRAIPLGTAPNRSFPV